MVVIVCADIRNLDILISDTTFYKSLTAGLLQIYMMTTRHSDPVLRTTERPHGIQIETGLLELQGDLLPHLKTVSTYSRTDNRN